MTGIGFAFEATLAVLLVVAVIYCWRLDQRLSSLRKGHDGMIAAARELAETIQHAELAIKGMRVSADESARDLQRKIDQAKSLSRSLAGDRPARRGY